MDPIFSITASSLIRDNERLQILGRNLAGAGIAGHRAEIPVMSAFEPMLDPLVTTPAASSITTLADQRQGAIRTSNRSLDFALEGPGFFVLQRGDETVLTRNGAFSLDAEGMLTDGRGFQVMSASGGELFIGSDDVQLSADGVLRRQEEVLGQLAVQDVDGEPLELHQTRVLQGVLETSNVDTADQMIRMMETTRHFGLAARALRAYDGMLESAIEQAAEF